MTGNYEDAVFDSGAAAVIRDAYAAGQEPTVLEPGMIHAWFSHNGHIQLVDLTDDKYLDEPKRKFGTVHVQDVASFAAYYQKHKTNGESEIFANPSSYTVVGVLNAHAAGEAHWQDHKVQLKLSLTPEWQAWVSLHQQLIGQNEFGEFIEYHAEDIAPGEVSAAVLLKLAEEFTAKVNVSFSQGTRLRDGQTQFQYIEAIEAGGKSGTLVIPHSFKVAIRPFQDCDHATITARFRYRLQGKQLKLGYVLDNPEKVVRDAMLGVVAKVGEITGDTVLLGSAP